ncbi:germ cell nuclear acidic protein-like isoform X2 [Sycon ciliatum]|uniref:germ cell nuclear acidic protein-like isoform X2 n=1 Tax=Sycon ciliatum TaxID=27933 RepID=UPI0031F5F264
MKQDQLRATLKTNVTSLCQRLEDTRLCQCSEDAARWKAAAATAKSIPEWQGIILAVKRAIKERFLTGYLCDPQVQTALLRVDMARLKKTSVTPGYPREWEFFVSKAESYGQLLLLWRLLSESIDWRSSIKAVKCRVCKKKDDLDNMRVCDDCNGCWHTACKADDAPKLAHGICCECKLFNRQYRKAEAVAHESLSSDAQSTDTSDGYTAEEYCFDSAAEDGDSDLDHCFDDGDDRHGCASGDAAKKSTKMKCKTARPPRDLAAAEEQESVTSPDDDDDDDYDDDDDDDDGDVSSDSSLDDSDALPSDSIYDNNAIGLSDSCHDDNYAAPGNGSHGGNDVTSSDSSHGDNDVLSSDSSPGEGDKDTTWEPSSPITVKPKKRKSGRQAEQGRWTSSVEVRGAAQASLHGSQPQLSLDNESSTASQIAPSKKRKETAQTGQRAACQAKSSRTVPLSTPIVFTTPTAPVTSKSKPRQTAPSTPTAFTMPAVPATPKAKPSKSKEQATSSEAKRNTPKAKPSKPRKQFATPEATGNTPKAAATMAGAKATNSSPKKGETIPGDATLDDDLQALNEAVQNIFASEPGDWMLDMTPNCASSQSIRRSIQLDPTEEFFGIIHAHRSREYRSRASMMNDVRRVFARCQQSWPCSLDVQLDDWQTVAEQVMILSHYQGASAAQEAFVGHLEKHCPQLCHLYEPVRF